MEFFLGFLLLFFDDFIVLECKQHHHNFRIDLIEKANIKPYFVPYYIENCELNICKEGQIKHYPYEIIERLVEDKVALQQLRGFIFNQTFGPDIAGRSGFDFRSTTQLCRTKGSITQPYVMRNIDHNWKYIVNVKNKFEQHFFVEACVKSDKDNVIPHLCDEIFGQPGGNGDTKRGCFQKFQRVTLLVYENNTLEYDKFDIPTTCECSCLFFS